MLMGKSIFHLNQVEGRFYTKGEIGGYYSDLRHKVTGDILLDDEDKVPVNVTNSGKRVRFPIAIFQYGLGAYDLYLETDDEIYLEKFRNSVNWAIDNQREDGAWDCFGWLLPETKYSSMAQAEGASLLCRAYSEWQDVNFLKAARHAIDFMLIPVEKGGTTCYCDNGAITFEEKAGQQTILNGMVFSIWGLYDLSLLVHESIYEQRLSQAVDYLCQLLPHYDRSYWSDYDLEGNVASRFYHSLHIEQLNVLHNLFGKDTFRNYSEIWNQYNESFFKPKRAFVKKALQKMKTMSSGVAFVK